MGLSGAFVLAAVLLVVAALRLLAWYGANARRDALKTMCSSRGWTYEASDQSLVTRWAGDPFDKGTNHRARNVVVGETSGRRFMAFDYTYDVRRSNGGVGSSSTTYR
ncbi:MAG: hypothetical protein WAN48_12165, partial [Actinomycetes bacterium]